MRLARDSGLGSNHGCPAFFHVRAAICAGYAILARLAFAARSEHLTPYNSRIALTPTMFPGSGLLHSIK